MKALTFEGARRLAWHDVPGPVIAGGRQAIVRPIASTTCDLDQRIIAGRSPFEPPFAIGHECVAEVVDIGSSVRSVKPGDVVGRGSKTGYSLIRVDVAGSGDGTLSFSGVVRDGSMC